VLLSGLVALAMAANGRGEVAFSRIIRGWTNYSTAFNATHDLGNSGDYASVAALYTPDKTVRPSELGVIVIWDGSGSQRLDFARFSFLVLVWSRLEAFIQNPKQGDLGTWSFAAPTGGSTAVRDTTTRGGRPAYEIRFAITNAPLVLTNGVTYLIGFAARTVTANFGELYVPTSSHPGPSDVHAGDLVPGGWQYIVNEGGSTIYDGQLAMEFVVQPVVELGIRPLNRHVQISWPGWASDFQLEYTTSLTSPITWWPVDEEVIVQDDFRTVVVPATLPRMWFRLGK
jgi:hypothetical protein